MKFLFYGNTGNVGYRVSKWLQRNNYEVELHFPSNKDHNRSQPGWLNPEYKNDSPSWVKPYREWKYYHRFFPPKEIYAKARTSDVVLTCGIEIIPALVLPSQVFLISIGADVKQLPFRYDIKGRILSYLYKKRIKNLSGLSTGQLQTVKKARELGVPKKKIHLLGFPDDIKSNRENMDNDYLNTLREKYAEYDLIFLNPSRKNINKKRESDYKGSEKFLNAYELFLQEKDDENKVKSVFGEHGNDLREFKKLIRKSSLDSNQFDWIGHLPPPKLHAFMNFSKSIVFDQFGTITEMTLGGCSREALSMGSILVTATDPENKYFQKMYGKDCPILYAKSTEELFSRMSYLNNLSKSKLKELRLRSKKWAYQNLDCNIWIDKLVNILRSL
jgi:hypothetical protein